MSTPIYHDGHIYGVDSGTGSLTCIDAQDGAVRWQQKGFEHGGLVGVDGAIVALDGNSGDLVMVEMTPKAYSELGRIKPFFRRPGGSQLRGNVWSAPIVADGKAVIRDRNQMVCLDLK
ncbi:MAG: hypothetical protein ACE15C_01385 [Phycisphaerae bacterium]